MKRQIIDHLCTDFCARTSNAWFKSNKFPALNSGWRGDLIAQNGDPSQEPFAFAQTYFAIQTPGALN